MERCVFLRSQSLHSGVSPLFKALRSSSAPWARRNVASQCREHLRWHVVTRSWRQRFFFILPGRSNGNIRWYQGDMGMDQYLWKYHLLGGWTSINPSCFDVNKRGTRFWHTAISGWYQGNIMIFWWWYVSFKWMRSIHSRMHNLMVYYHVKIR